MNNSKIKKILSKIEDIKNQANKQIKSTSVENKKELKKRVLKVLEKTLKYLEEK